MDMKCPFHARRKLGNKYRVGFLLMPSKQYMMLIRNIITTQRRKCWPTNLSEIYENVSGKADDEETFIWEYMVLNISLETARKCEPL